MEPRVNTLLSPAAYAALHAEVARRKASGNPRWRTGDVVGDALIALTAPKVAPVAAVATALNLI